MSYQVLARKWRPRFFREMVGQEHVLQALINALDHNRLHHAYLFTGTRGVGKTTIARILAKCLNCEVGVSSEPCGQCSSCKDINDGCFIDLIEIDAASHTGVENMRSLTDNTQYMPAKGRYKVYLIDEVHMLSTNSFNALLKTLEEPPEHVKFLLATTDPQKLPATVLSRCLQFHLKNMIPERIVKHLHFVLQQEMVEFEELALWSLARAAQGSMRDALSLTDQAIAFGSGKVLENDVRSMLGTIDQQTVYRLAEALFSHDANTLLNVVADCSEQSPDYMGVIDELLLLLHRITIAQIVPVALDDALGDKNRVLDLAQNVTAEELQLFYQMGVIGKRDLPLAPDLRTGLEMALLRMLAFRPEGLVEPPTKTLVHNGESKLPSGAVNIKKSEAVVSNAVNNIDVTLEITAQSVVLPLQEALPENPPAALDLAKPIVLPIISKVESTSIEKTESIKKISNNEDWILSFHKIPFTSLLKAIAAECVLDSVTGNLWQFSLNREKAQLYNSSHAQQIATILSNYFSEKIEVTIQERVSVSLTPADHVAEQKRILFEKTLDELQKDAGIQYLIKEYSAKIINETVVERVTKLH